MTLKNGKITYKNNNRNDKCSYVYEYLYFLLKNDSKKQCIILMNDNPLSQKSAGHEFCQGSMVHR
jgi:hypothetical protein